MADSTDEEDCVSSSDSDKDEPSAAQCTADVQLAVRKPLF